MTKPLRFAALIGAALLCLAASPSSQPYRWDLPPGVAPPPVPADNPMSAAKVELGRRLFYDADLSIDGTIACATCHEQHRAFAEGNATHGGVRGAQGRRNVMALANVGYLAPLTWARPDLRTLESHFLVPVLGEHPVEMGMAGREPELVRRLGADPCYRSMFAASFPEEDGRISTATIAKAVAAFERTLLSFDSPYDRYRRGDGNAIDDAAKRGAALFFGERLHCAGCHAGPNFTDGAFHALGSHGTAGTEVGPDADRGLAEASNDPADTGRFRTPGLRNAALTAPYLHDGSVRTLSQAIASHLAADAGARTPRDAALPTGSIGDGDTGDLVAFIDSLTDSGFISDPRLALPKAACGKKL